MWNINPTLCPLSISGKVGDINLEPPYNAQVWEYPPWWRLWPPCHPNIWKCAIRHSLLIPPLPRPYIRISFSTTPPLPQLSMTFNGWAPASGCQPSVPQVWNGSTLVSSATGTISPVFITNLFDLLLDLIY